MSFSMRESFDCHSKNYGNRVRDRTSLFLRKEEWIITHFLKRNWDESEPATLIDAGCGTGDRLSILFSSPDFPKTWFKRIIGIDFSSGMLDIARQQEFNGKLLYDELYFADLTEIEEVPKGELVLSLWSIPNLACNNANKLLSNLGRMVEKNGFLIYDVMTTHLKLLEFFKEENDRVLSSHPELSPHDDDHTLWRENEDGTYYYLKLFEPKEINELVMSTKLDLHEVWGYMHSGLGHGLIELDGNSISCTEIAEYTGLMLCYKNVVQRID